MLVDEEASRFVHDQVGRRYIPIMGIGRGKADFDVAARDHCDPVGERGHLPLRLNIDARRGESFNQGNRAGDACPRQ